MSVTPPLVCYPFSEPRRNVEVPAGEYRVVWEEHMTGGFVGFIDRISVSRGDNNLGNDDTWVDFIVDGKTIERIKREISLNLPDRFVPEQVVKEKVIFRAYNGNSSSHQFEVVVQGRVCRPKSS